MEVTIADLTWSSFICPRGRRSKETVKAYVEALKVGATFPPIKVQRLFNYPKDKKRIARDIASSDPECTWTEEALAKKLGAIQQTVNTWISDIRACQKAGRNVVIIRLICLGWA